MQTNRNVYLGQANVLSCITKVSGERAAFSAGETVVVGGVKILGPVNLPATVPLHASQMYSKNLTTFVEYITEEGALTIDLDDSITGPMCVVANGEVRFGRTT